MKNYVKVYKGYQVPEGATHWQPDREEWFDCFIKYEGDETMYWNAKYGDSWEPLSSVVSPFIYELPEAKQERNGKEWDGKGFPPVGAECEISYDGRPWKKCLINYSGKSIIVCIYESGAERAYSTKGIIRFRPVKTQEQKDREAFVHNCRIVTMGIEPQKIFHYLYEAGARFK